MIGRRFHTAINSFDRFTMVEWLTDPTATLAMMGLRPHLRRFFIDLFLKSIQSSAQKNVKRSVWHCRNLLRPMSVSGENLKSTLLFLLSRWVAIINDDGYGT